MKPNTWKEHASRGNIPNALLDLTLGMDPNRLKSATQWADEAYSSCDVCPENCGVDRHTGQLGKCGLDADARVYKEYLHFGEEAL